MGSPGLTVGSLEERKLGAQFESRGDPRARESTSTTLHRDNPAAIWFVREGKWVEMRGGTKNKDGLHEHVFTGEC